MYALIVNGKVASLHDKGFKHAASAFDSVQDHDPEHDVPCTWIAFMPAPLAPSVGEDAYWEEDGKPKWTRAIRGIDGYICFVDPPGAPQPA